MATPHVNKKMVQKVQLYMKVGLKNAHIARILGKSRKSVWRWAKYDFSTGKLKEGL